jgi:hypothetical protein
MKPLSIVVFSLWHLWSTCCSINAQPATSEIAEDRLRFICVENGIGAYRDYCTLLDTNGVITDASIQRFEALFEPNARVLNDLRAEQPYLISMRDYVSYAYSYLDSTGITAYLTDYRYAAIIPEDYPYSIQDIAGEKVFSYELPMTKVLLNGIDNEEKPIVYENPISIKIVFTLHYYEKQEKVLITKITKEEPEQPKERLRKKGKN